MSEQLKEQEVSEQVEQAVGVAKAENESSGGVHDSPSAGPAPDLAVSKINFCFGLFCILFIASFIYFYRLSM
ncbi:hypothetical protein EON65_04215 [archaeon]|nr:MAG: hypothetical protein EON65_04215 [archaeon]